MNTIILNKKKYVVIEQEKFEELQLEAARKTEPVKKNDTCERKAACLQID